MRQTRERERVEQSLSKAEITRLWTALTQDSAYIHSLDSQTQDFIASFDSLRLALIERKKALQDSITAIFTKLFHQDKPSIQDKIAHALPLGEVSSVESKLDSTPTPPSTGWEIKTLGDICELNPKVDLQPLAKLGKAVSFLPMEAVKTDGKSFETLQRNAREAKGFTKFANNDLLWAKITPCMQNKKSVVVSGLKNGYGFGSTEFFVLRPRDSRQTNMYFVLQFLRLDIILQNAVKNLKGSAGQQRVPKEFLQNLQIPLPPIAVQEQIVTQVEQIEEKIATTKQSRLELERELECYLESIL